MCGNSFRKCAILIVCVATLLCTSVSAYPEPTRLQDCFGTWLLEEEPVSTLQISDMKNGQIYVDAFYYRIWSMTGTATVTRDGKKAVFQSENPNNEMGILELRDGKIYFDVVMPPSETTGGIEDFLMDHTFVYYR